jgi:capsular polysaccharide transport system permease protein
MSSAPNNITRLPTARTTALESKEAVAKEERARANELAVNEDREMVPRRDDEARRELALDGAEDETFSLVPLPQPDHNWSRTLISFGIVVLLPLCLLGLYFLFLATPQYFAEFRFSVTEVTPSAGPLGGGGSGGTTAAAVASAMGGHGGAVSGGTAQNFVVIDYLKSRQVVDELSQNVDIREIYSRPEIDWPNRFDKSRSTEHLVRYWNKMVWANYDPLTGLATVEIKAFRPDDALTVANQLVTLSENLVNKIAKRAEEDAVKFAEQEVVRAKAGLDKARAAMAEFREKEGVIDPIPSVVTGNTQLIGTLRGSVSQLEADYDTIRRQNLSESAPSVLALKSRVQAAREQLASVEREVSGSRSGRNVLAGVVARFEALDMDRQYAQAILLTSLQSLDRARASAAAQHLYLTPYVRPALPESAGGPRVFLSMALGAFILAAIWFIGLLAVRSIVNSRA